MSTHQRIVLGYIFVLFFTIVTIWLAKMVPVEETRTVKVEKVVIEKIERVVVPMPPKRTYPPLKDPHDACHGSPVVVLDVVLSKSQQEDDEQSYSWFTVRPAGDDYKISCYMGGRYEFEKGDLVVLMGTPTDHAKLEHVK